MADVVDPAPHRARGAATAVRTTTPFAVFDVPAASSTSGGAAPVPAALVAAAALVICASAHLSATLAYFAAFAASLVPVARAAWPEEADGGLVGRLDARLRLWARAALASARADLAADMRLLRRLARGSAAVAPVYDRAEETARVAFAAGAGALRSRAEAAWRQHRAAARAAWFLLGLVLRTIVAGLVEEAYDGAVARAPAVLSCLRGVVKEIIRNRTRGAVSSSGVSYKDMSCLVKTAACVVICGDVLVSVRAVLGLPFRFWVPCVAATCFTALTVAEWVCGLLEDDPVEPTRAVEVRNKVPESWRYLWFLTVAAHVADVHLLRLVLGARPVAVAFLALCNAKVIDVGKRVQRAPQHGDGESVNGGGAGKWRRAVKAVLAASVAKVLAIHVLLGFQLAALSLASLGVTAVLLLIREENLSDLEAASGEDKKDGEEGAGVARNGVAGGAEEEADEVKAEHSKTTVDDAEAIGDGSEEQGHEEPDHSSSMDDWDVVEMDDFDSPRVAVADQS